MNIFDIYLLCFGTGLLFTIVSALLGEVFGGHDVDAHADVDSHVEGGFDHSAMPGISVFSPTIIASFITGFGGFGMLYSKIPLTSSPWLSAPLAILSGFGVAGGIFLLLAQLFARLQCSSEGHVDFLIGTDATIITPIPQQGVGEIAYVQNGSRYTAPARSESGEAVPNGSTVRIQRIVGTQFYVSPEQP